MPDVVCVAGLDHGTAGAVDAALAVLNRSQDRFVFQGVPGPELPAPDLGGAYSFRLLDGILGEHKQRIRADFLVGVLGQPIERNYFSHARRKRHICFITTSDWEYLSRLPVYTFVAYSIVRNLVGMLIGQAHGHDETRGCLYDFCGHKPDYSFKIRTADICHDCLDFLRDRLEPPVLETTLIMLEAVRLAALGRGQRPEPSATPSLPEIVDRDFPFPIAYCLRSMQTELGYSRKWLKLLELFEVIIKYVSIVLLADRPRRDDGQSPSSAAVLSGLSRPSIGHWHATCFALLAESQGRAVPGFVARAVGELDRRGIRAAHAASEQLVASRNETRGHGFVEEEARYQRCYEEGLPLVQSLMEFAIPIARYRLIKVGQGLQHSRGAWAFTAKNLRGSHPLFAVQEHRTIVPVDTDCCVLHDEEAGTYLSLYPWLLFDTCQECYREMVFLYDKVDKGGVVMREYPTNHTKRRKDLTDAVKGLIE